MNVVFACLDADTLGGIQRVTHTLAQGLAERGHAVRVVGLHRSTAPFRYVAEPRYRRHVVGRAPPRRAGRNAPGRAPPPQAPRRRAPPPGGRGRTKPSPGAP
ncbi:glycosyltransferase, partial [Nonomuraea sp. NPDC050383]|uniref:glycosyltransferase n=1 Tax=Nonomuraea sp. NPDC050383 TaxID=3364362 RepID=UPI0037AFBC7D